MMRIKRKIVDCGVTLLVLLSVATTATGANKVVVIPLDFQTSKNANIVTVAKQGGEFDDPLAAMESIKDASQHNPYVIAIGPGTYGIDETLRLKPYVSLVGSGQYETRIRNTSATDSVTLALHAVTSGGPEDSIVSVSNLTIIKQGSGSNCVGISGNDGYYVRLSMLTVTASDCTNRNIALDLSEGPVVRVDSVTAIARGGREAIGVYATLLDVELNDLTVDVIGASESSVGVYTYFNKAIIKNSAISVSSRQGGVYGVWTQDPLGGEGSTKLRGTTIENTQITALTSGSSLSYGVYISETSNSATSPLHQAIIRRSTIYGDTAAVFADTLASAIISTTTLIGGVSGGAGNTGAKKCTASDDGEGNALSATCE